MSDACEMLLERWKEGSEAFSFEPFKGTTLSADSAMSTVLAQ